MPISFTSNGATPFGIPSQGMSGTSQSVGGANTNVGGQIGTALRNNQNSGFPQTSSPAANALSAAVSPTTPVKRQTTTSPDGTVNSVEYHAPATESSSSGTSSGVLSKAPTQPLAVSEPAPQGNATYNPYTGSTGNNPTMGQGITTSNPSPYNATNQNGNNGLLPNSEFQSSTNTTYPMTPNAPTSTTPATFPGIVSNLANTSSGGSSNSTQATQGLLQSPNQNETLSNEAAAIGNNYGQQIAQASNYGQGLVGGELTSGAISPIAQGTAGISQGITSAKVQGLTSAENAALAPINQELTAQSQAQSGLEGAGANANTQQSNVQSGLTSAGSLAAPGTANVALGQGQNLVNSQGQTVSSTPVIAPVGTQSAYQVTPTTYTNGQPNANPTTAGATIQSGDTFNSLATQYGTTAAALEAANPSLNPNDLQVGQRINVPQSGTGGNTPFAGGQAQGNAALGQTYQTNKAVIAALPGIQQKIATDISQNGINSLSSANLANAVNDWVQGNLSDPNLANFFNDLTDYSQTVAPLIGIQGSPTDQKTAIAQQMISPTMSGASMLSVLNNLQSLAQNKNDALLTAGQGGSSTSAGTSGQTFSTPSGGTIAYNPATGQYEAQK